MRVKNPGLETYSTARKFFLAVIACDKRYQSSVDCFGGSGPWFVVRRCRQLHLKGDHANWYSHITFKQFETLEEARADCSQDCSVFDQHHIRSTVENIACYERTSKYYPNHQVLHIFLENDEWHCVHS